MNAPTFRLDGKSTAVLLVFSASLLLVNLGGNRVLTFHEGVFCTPAKEMLASGNWIVPTIAGVPFLEKPPFTAWLMAGMMAITGSQSEWVVRLPGVFAGILTAWIIAALAARWYGPRVGLVAGLIQVTTYYLLQLSRLAECDTHLILAVCGSMCAFAAANIESPAGRSTARWLPWAFYLGAGLAFLVKGPLGVLFIFSGCGLYLAIRRDARGLWFFASPLGLALFALCILPYVVIAGYLFPPYWEATVSQNAGRFSGQLGGGKPPLFYLYQVPLGLMPWFPFALLHVVRHGRKLLSEPLWQFAACWLIPGMTLLCLSTFKVKNYPTPLLPAASILAALGLIEYLRWTHARSNVQRCTLAVLAVVACVAGTVAIYRLGPPGGHAMIGIAVLAGMATLIALVLERGERLGAQLGTVFGLAWLAIAGVFTFIMPHHDTYHDQAVFARRINSALPNGSTVHVLCLPENQIFYYLNPSVQRIDAHWMMLEQLQRERRTSYYVLAPEHVADALASQGKIHVLDRCDSVPGRLQPNERMTLVRLERGPEYTAGAEAHPPR